MTDDLIPGHLSSDLVGELRSIAWMRDDNEAKLMDCAAVRLAAQQQEIERLEEEIAGYTQACRTLIDRARAAAIEEAAKACEAFKADEPETMRMIEYRVGIASAIRALNKN